MEEEFPLMCIREFRTLRADTNGVMVNSQVIYSGRKQLFAIAIAVIQRHKK